MSLHLPPLFCSLRANTTTLYKPEERNKSGFCFSTPEHYNKYRCAAPLPSVCEGKKLSMEQSLCDSEDNNVDTVEDKEVYLDKRNEEHLVNTYDDVNKSKINYAMNRLWLREEMTSLYHKDESERKDNKHLIKSTVKGNFNEEDCSCKLFRPSIANQVNSLINRRNLMKRKYYLHNTTSSIHTKELCDNEHRKEKRKKCVFQNNVSTKVLSNSKHKCISNKDKDNNDNDKDNKNAKQVEDNVVYDSRETVCLLFALRNNNEQNIKEKNNEVEVNEEEEENDKGIEENDNDSVEYKERDESKNFDYELSHSLLENRYIHKTDLPIEEWKNITSRTSLQNGKAKNALCKDSTINNENRTATSHDILMTKVEWLPSARDMLSNGLTCYNTECEERPRFAHTQQQSICDNEDVIVNDNIIKGNERQKEEILGEEYHNNSYNDNLDTSHDLENSVDRKLYWLQYAEQNERRLITFLEYEQNVIPLYCFSPGCNAIKSRQSFISRVLQLRSTSEIEAKLQSIQSTTLSSILQTSSNAVQCARERIEQSASLYLSQILIRKAEHEKELLWFAHGSSFYDVLTQMLELINHESNERNALVCEWAGCEDCKLQHVESFKKALREWPLNSASDDFNDDNNNNNKRNDNANESKRDIVNSVSFFSAVITHNYNILQEELLGEYTKLITFAHSLIALSKECNTEELSIMVEENRLRERLYDYHNHCLHIAHIETSLNDTNTTCYKKEEHITSKNNNKYVRCNKNSPFCSYLSYRLMRICEQTALEIAEEHIFVQEQTEWLTIMQECENEYMCILLDGECFTESLPELTIEEETEWCTLIKQHEEEVNNIHERTVELERKCTCEEAYNEMLHKVELFAANSLNTMLTLAQEQIEELIEQHRAYRLELLEQKIREERAQLGMESTVQGWLMERRVHEVMCDESRLRLYCGNEERRDWNMLNKLEQWQREEWYCQNYLQLIIDEENAFALLMLICKEEEYRQVINKAEQHEWNTFYMPQLISCMSPKDVMTRKSELNLRHYVLANLQDFLAMDKLQLLFSTQREEELQEEEEEQKLLSSSQML